MLYIYIEFAQNSTNCIFCVAHLMCWDRYLAFYVWQRDKQTHRMRADGRVSLKSFSHTTNLIKIYGNSNGDKQQYQRQRRERDGGRTERSDRKASEKLIKVVQYSFPFFRFYFRNNKYFFRFFRVVPSERRELNLFLSNFFRCFRCCFCATKIILHFHCKLVDSRR